MIQISGEEVWPKNHEVSMFLRDMDIHPIESDIGQGLEEIWIGPLHSSGMIASLPALSTPPPLAYLLRRR